MNSDSIGKFCGSVLLSEDCWDKNKLIKDLSGELYGELDGIVKLASNANIKTMN